MKGLHRNSSWRLAGLALAGGAAATLLGGCGKVGGGSGETLGFAVVGWRTAVYETP